MGCSVPASVETSVDPRSGRTVIHWTAASAKSQHLYFTSPSVTADGRYLVFISEQSGAPNLHVPDRTDGSTRQLSHADAMLRAYCYPQGATHGFSKATPYLDAQRQHVYWVQDDVAWRVSLQAGAEPERLAALPAGWYTGFTHLSPDGRTFCVPCTDPRAFSAADKTQTDQMAHVPWRMLEAGLVTRLCMIDVERHEVRDTIELPFWVTHVQFDPAGSGRLLFNCEGKVGGHGDRQFPYWGRIWGIEPGGEWRRLYDQTEEEAISHENWMPSGEGFVYHGYQRATRQQPFITARTWDGGLIFQHPTGDLHICHAISTHDTRRFTFDSPDGHVYLYDLDALPNEQVVQLSAHDSSFCEQDAHPHPIMNPAGDGVVFTSDHGGTCNVYEVLLA